MTKKCGMRNEECRMQDESAVAAAAMADAKRGMQKAELSMKNAYHHNSALRTPHSAFPCAPAFTLIELVVTIVIMAIIALVTVDYLVNAGRVYTLLLAQRQADSDAMAVVKRMRREARVLQANITNTSAAWAFSTPGYTNSFEWSGNAVFLNNNILAQNVQTFWLDYYDATNGLLTPLPLSSNNQSRVSRVALELRVTNNLAASELKVNFFLRKGFLK